MFRNPSFIVALIISILGIGETHTAEDPARPPSLKTISVPEPDNLDDFIIDKQKAIELGKALFWEMRVGSDGVTACATCHFNAGTDSRSFNQVNPGSNRIHNDGKPDADLTFDFGPAQQLMRGDFPLRKLSNISDRSSPAISDSNDVVSSQGVQAADFLYTVRGKSKDVVTPKIDADGFLVDHKNVRRVAPRNAPSIINAIFNFRNLSNGSAQNDFNGVNKWGGRDPDAKVYRVTSGSNQIEAVTISLTNSSLASQAVAPPVSDREMSATGRTFPDIGRKLISMRPLALQQVHPQDSVFGEYSRWPHSGLTIPSYKKMIQAAFHPQWWNSEQFIRNLGNATTSIMMHGKPQYPNEYSLMEYNFSLFFGLAVQMYVSTLVADDTPYDRFMMGDASAISAAAIQGVDVFRSQTRGRCINCHEGAELTGASITRVTASPVRVREEQAFDRGFNHIGVRPATEDIGLGGKDPFGNELSYSRHPATVIPNCTNGLPCPVIADGFIKVPGLRNIELTAPYFHNGGTLTLREILDLYSRGGNFHSLEQLDGSEIAGLNILFNSEEEKSNLEAFLLSLTDERVRLRKAPFDHPQLLIPIKGHHLLDKQTNHHSEAFLKINAVGRNGGVPLKRFLQ